MTREIFYIAQKIVETIESLEYELVTHEEALNDDERVIILDLIEKLNYRLYQLS
jgi:hypothetical protein